MRFIVVPADASGHLREATAGADNALDPRQITAGPHAGESVLPERVLTDAAFDAFAASLRDCSTIEADPDELWPSEVEDQ